MSEIKEDGYFYRWLAENLTSINHTPQSLSNFAYVSHRIKGEDRADVVSILQDLLSPKGINDTRDQSRSCSWWRCTLRTEAILYQGRRVGRKWSFTTILPKVVDGVIYSPGKFASLATETDLVKYNAANSNINLELFRFRLRITLSAFRRRNILVPATGNLEVAGQGSIPGWSGKIWLSACGLLCVNNLHVPE